MTALAKNVRDWTRTHVVQPVSRAVSGDGGNVAGEPGGDVERQARLVRQRRLLEDTRVKHADLLRDLAAR